MLGLVTDTLSLKPTVSAIICEKTKPNFYIFLNNFHSFQYFLIKMWLDHTYGMSNFVLNFHNNQIILYTVDGTIIH